MEVASVLSLVVIVVDSCFDASPRLTSVLAVLWGLYAGHMMTRTSVRDVWAASMRGLESTQDGRQFSTLNGILLSFCGNLVIGS